MMTRPKKQTNSYDLEECGTWAGVRTGSGFRVHGWRLRVQGDCESENEKCRLTMTVSKLMAN